MMIKKYPIGTKIRFIADENMHALARKDGGKSGKIVGYCGDLVSIFLPESTSNTSGNNITWTTAWECIEKLPQKNEQLLFSFMGEQDDN